MPPRGQGYRPQAGAEKLHFVTVYHTVFFRQRQPLIHGYHSFPRPKMGETAAFVKKFTIFIESAETVAYNVYAVLIPRRPAPEILTDGGKPTMFKELIEKLKAHPRTIVFTEGPDARILEATDRLLKDDLMDVILIGNVDEVKAAAEKGNFCICKATIIDPATYPEMDEMAQTMFDLRKGKMDMDTVKANLAKGNYFGTMLVKMGKADALLGGATYSTADTVRPALQLVKTKPGAHLVSSCFILSRPAKDGGEEMYAMGDCAINISYEDTVDKKTGEVTLKASEKIAEVAIETAKTAAAFGIDPKVAMLSYSTMGSGKGPTVTMMREATEAAKALAPDLAVDGELQFDAAFSPVVAKTKAKNSPVAGQANTFIFPDINAGNIGYKIAQRLGGFEAYGPILQGLNAPINDLSRGCNADEVYQMAIITAGLK